MTKRTKQTPAFHIVVSPVGSKFAKALQGQLKATTNTPVFRRSSPKAGRSFFQVTQRTLNKVEQFERFAAQNVSSPKFATSSEAARSLDCRTLFARTLINSTNGRGIVEFNQSDDVYPRAPLYTEYIPKRAEYRYHVFGGQVIDVQEKRKRRGLVDERNPERQRNTRVRNMHNGYVYCRDGITPPDGAADLAIRAVAACGYQYGAVDLIYNEKRNQCYVLEVNSRPGLMGATLESYGNAIINTFNLPRCP